MARRTAAFVVASGVLIVGGHRVASADRDRAGWGESTRVLVTNREIAAGDLIGPDDLEWRSWPVGLVPDGAVRTIPTESRRVATDMARGEVLIASRWADEHKGAWAVELTDVETAVQLTLDQPLDGVSPGDQVDVVAVLESAGSFSADYPATHVDEDISVGAAGAAIVAHGARVLRVDGSTAVLAVDSNEATATAVATISGPVALVVHP